MTEPLIPSAETLQALQRRTEREKSARKVAEKLLEQKSLELYSANQALQAAQAELKSQINVVESERDRIKQIAITDSLTKLTTRSAFLENLKAHLLGHALSNAHHSETELWLVVIRLKKFKRVNEQLGQIGADKVLQITAQRLAQFVADKQGEAARFSGTEFAFYCPATKPQLQTYLDQLSHCLSETIAINNRAYIVEFSIAAGGSKLTDNNADTLRTAVDHVLSKVRRSDRNSLMIYDEVERKGSRFRKQLEDEIRISLVNQEFIPWFQPILYSRDARSICLEALARWPKHGGVIRPDQFIPVAHDLGVWPEIDKQLFVTACEQVKPLIDQGSVTDLSVNVSPLQLIMPDFISGLKRLLADTKFPADHLILEITEDVLIEDVATIHSQIQRLHALGIKIAVDDFGTGYSNLKNLIDLPIDTVKIDRSLVMDIERDNRATMLISTLVQWARAINVSVVAEGVETETQAILLRALGCNRLQGYYFGKAMSVKHLKRELPRLLEAAEFRQRA